MNTVDVEFLRRHSSLRCREITGSDLERIVDLLARGFPARGRRYWARALDRLAKRQSPPEFPKFGYVLESDGAPVGVILLIFSTLSINGRPSARCNLSSWYVDPAFRAQGALLVSRALRHKGITYVNVSPAPHTRPTIEAQGFLRYTDGQFLAFPWLAKDSAPLHIGDVGELARPADSDLAAEFDLLAAHKDLGCISLWCTASDGIHPFVFLPRRIVKRLLPVLQLAYCRDIGDFVRFAGPLGRYLAARGHLLVLMDAPGPIPGLPGKYFAGSGPKYFRGPDVPRLGDLAFTEAVLFGA